MGRLSRTMIPKHRPVRARAFLPHGPSIKPEWFSESLDGWTYVQTGGRTGMQKVETVAPTNFQDKGVNNGPGNQ